MLVNIFGRIENATPLQQDIAIAGNRLYVFLKEHKGDGKVNYEYMGSMMSTLEDDSSSFVNTFLPVATHYAVPADETPSQAMDELKAQLDEHDRNLYFEGQESF